METFVYILKSSVAHNNNNNNNNNNKVFNDYLEIKKNTKFVHENLYRN